MANDSLILEVIHEFSYLANLNIQKIILSRFETRNIISNPLHDLFYTVENFQKEQFFDISEEKLLQILKSIKEVNETVKEFINKNTTKESDLLFLRNIFADANKIIGNILFKKTDISGNDIIGYDLTGNDLAQVFEKTLRQQEEMNAMISNIEKKYEAERRDFQNQIDKYKNERDSLIKQLNDTIVDSKAEANEIGEIKTKLQNEWDEFKNNYKEIFAKAEIMRQSQNFKDDANAYYKMSKKWIIWIVVSIIVVIVTSIILLAGCFDDVKCILDYQDSIKNGSLFVVLFYQKIISKILLRLFILAIMLYILKFVLRQYNALMHNYTISAHKNSSLFGALRIVEVLPQGKVQEEFISVAGKEIFTQHKTGYLNKEEGLIDLTLLQKISDLISRK